MLNSLPVRLIWHSFSWLTRLTIVVSTVVAVLIAFAVIVMRYWLLPDIEQYHDKISASLSSAIGNPVTIGKIKGDWQGFLPHLNFTDVRILDGQRQPALVLPSIDGSVSWMSLLTAELRLASLEIDKPELLIRRDAQGNVFIGGVALSQQGSDNDLADWLLHQSRMVVRDALIVWVDEQRDAAPLVLQQVNLRIESFFSHHRFALRALPPEELATPLDVRGDFRGASFDDLNKWRGQIFTQLDYTDVTAWRPWLDLPKEFSRGRGALRGWLSIEGGRVAGVTVDLALHNVVTKLAEDVPEMALLNLRGRAAWKDVEGGFEVSTKNLSMRLHNGIGLQPTDFYFRTTKTSDGQPAGGEIRANLLQLESLAGLANFLPLEAGLRAQLDAYAPRGRVSDLDAQWQGAFEKPDSYKIKGHFNDLAVHQVGKMPGFSGLSIDVDGSDESGRLNINTRQLAVDAPGIMREPLYFSTLIGQAGWQRKRGEISINVDNIAVSNDDLAGNVYGSYRTQAGTLGVLDLTVGLTRGDVRRAARYTPLIALHKKENDWLNGALLAGHTEDFRLRIKGNLSDFPLDGTKKTLLEIGGHARDVVLEFDKHWPRIENITGNFLIHGNKLEVKSSSATMLGTHLQNATATLPDMVSHDLSLEVKGEAVGASNALLQFIQQSPVRGYIDGFTDGMSASGSGHLDLFANIPLSGNKPVKVAGMIRVQDNDINLGEGVPLLRNTRGALLFTESGMQANGVLAEILGGTASINVQTVDGGAVHAIVQGRNNLDTLRNSTPHPLLNYLHGGATWDADIRVVKKSAQVLINSNLQGISSSLPKPFTKTADEVMPLHMEKVDVAEGQDVITVQLGKLLNARLARRDENGAMIIKRGTINFGDKGSGSDIQGVQHPPAKTASVGSLRGKDGVWLTGNLPVLSIQGWEDLVGGTERSGSIMPISGANLRIEKLTGYGQTINMVHVDAAKRGDGLAARLSSSTLNGEVVWQPHGYEMGGKLSANLDSLQLMTDKQPEQVLSLDKPNKPIPVEKAGRLHPNSLPALEIKVENLQIKGQQIGRFELVGYPDKQDWRMRRVRITNPDGALMGDGIWHADAQTQLNLILDIKDAGKILGRSGYSDTVKGGSGKLTANLSWAGTPDEFNLATLSGTLNLDTGKGQFLKMDPGIGKLLSILSLQALPKHITLDFADVFSGGFQFDDINGNATIKNGVLDTQDLHIDGSSAQVTMKGNVDLNGETQNLRVRILPTIGNSVSLGAAFLGGPAVGVGALIVNKILRNPLDKLASFEYNVSGTWVDPKVVKIGRTPVNQGENQ